MIPRFVVCLRKFRTWRSFSYQSSFSRSVLFDSSLNELFESGLECFTMYSKDPTPYLYCTCLLVERISCELSSGRVTLIRFPIGKPLNFRSFISKLKSCSNFIIIFLWFSISFFSSMISSHPKDFLILFSTHNSNLSFISFSSTLTLSVGPIISRSSTYKPT